MNAAVLLSACVAVLQLGMGTLLIAVARAPGWRQARVFAVVAMSAAGYSIGNIGASWDPLGDPVRRALAAMSYVSAGIFVFGWLLYAFGGRDGRLRDMPRWAASVAVLALLGAAVSMTGLQLSPDRWVDIHAPGAGLHYRFPSPNALGSAITYAYLVGVLCVCVVFVRRARDGGREWEYLLGFSVFLTATVVEVLITNGIIRFFFIADIGFVAVVIPMAGETMRRFIDDAKRLSTHSTHLTEEIERRTQERDEAHDAWIEAERQASVGRLAAGVGHEINNPLAYLRLNLELIGEWGRDNASPPELMESVDGALDGADRIRRVVDALRASSRQGTGLLGPVTLETVAQDALRMAAHQLRGVEVELITDASPTIVGDETRLAQAMVNLLLNASQGIRERSVAAGDQARVTMGSSNVVGAPGVVGGIGGVGERGRPGGRITIRIGLDGAGRALLEVADNGAGISREDLRRLMQPYFSTRGGAGGIGFGLFLARGVFEQHGGTFEIASELGVGTQVRALLPATSDRPASVLERVRLGGADDTAGSPPTADVSTTPARAATVGH